MTNVSAFIDRLFGDIDRTVEAVVADGWPEPMVRAGFNLHRTTWDGDALTAALEAELAALGGGAGLDGFIEDAAGRSIRLERPESIVHIWPALPGAGLTPVLFGALLGVPQAIRASSRGRHFAEHVARIWPDVAAPLRVLAPDEDWSFGDVIVVSGSDETVAEVRRQASQARVMGYGHRVSFACVVDSDEIDLAKTAAALATDVVMWHQRGCFSARGVLFCGSDERLKTFGQLLGQAIAAAEARLDAATLGAAELAQRAQVRGVAEFTSTLWGDGVGWAQQVDGPFSGNRVAAHVVTLHRIRSSDRLGAMITVPRSQMQGVALAAAPVVRDEWTQSLAKLGVTRICEPGHLQAPPAGWLHDGRPNVLEWLRIVTKS